VNVPPLLESLPRPTAVQLVVGGPLLLGLVTGFFLGIDAATYWVLTGAATLGGFLGGLEHRTTRGAAARGLLAGALFGGGIVVADAVSDQPALAELPSPPILLVPLAALIGAGLHALGATVRRRYDPSTSS
jgi:4-hydroxybenzoate polyprenyltransferase